MKLATDLVHAGRDDLGALGVHALPIDLSTTYPVSDLATGTASFDALVGGAASAANPIYARLFNPTVARFEQAMAKLEHTEAAVGFASGMAAVSACLLAFAQGREVLAVRPIYGTSDHLLSSGLLGARVRFLEAEVIAGAINADTGLVFIETPANPNLDLVDIAQVVKAAGNVPVLVDSTFATPVLQNPADFGAALVLHSATKFLGGHGDVIAGVVACSEAHAQTLRQVRAATGALLHPLAAYLLHRGLPTLKLRVEAAQASARVLAERLAAHPQVRRVNYPGLGTVKHAHLLGTQLRGPGSLMSFELRGGHAAASACLQALELHTVAVSLGSVDSLIQHPAGLTHRVVAPEVLAAHGIGPGTLRLSVGLEDVEDLWADLQRGLQAAALTVEPQTRVAA
jgi:cystathionine beta-lyase/cystathionine gamma-synthase